ncbi:hypothetical protein [Rubrolithibacter danxiaensis]|uniref:hypothetical protein n=1 Tax=Rubrolithibacter danxiaensis TaxID=3390805 RepID=UPI003BF7C652
MRNILVTAPTSKSFSFIFKSDPSELFSLLSDIISLVKEQLPEEKYSPVIEGKCKLILTELLTNAIKHSWASETEVNVLIAQDYIEISKTDIGKAFYLPAFKERETLQWPLDATFTGKKITIYEDDMCGLYGYIEQGQRVVFSAEDHPIPIPPRPRDMLEHFGLIILTKSADEFIYEHNSLTRENTFTTKILL